MDDNKNQPMQFHESLRGLFTTFRNVITAISWLKCSVKQAQQFFPASIAMINLTSSFGESIVISRSILNEVESEGINQKAPLYSQTMINFYRIFTIAAKDIICQVPDFQNFKKNPELKFLRHLRNASAHHNKFFWGNKKDQHHKTIQKLPVSWRNKVIEEKLEGSTLYMDFMKPGDIFFLLSDISKLVS